MKITYMYKRYDIYIDALSYYTFVYGYGLDDGNDDGIIIDDIVDSRL